MAELATIARPYAEALFKASTTSGANLDETLAWLRGLASLASDARLREFADNPKVSHDQVFEVMVQIVKDALPQPALNFLRTVIDNGRLAAMSEIAGQFAALVNARNGSSDAVVYSAFDLDATALAELATTLQKRFGRKLNLTVQIDTSLIAGVRVAVGDEVLDTSVKARLEQMKAALSA